MSLAAWWLGRMAGLLLLLTVALMGFGLFGDDQSPGRRQLRNYNRALDQQLRFLRASAKHIHVLAGQLILSLLCVAVVLWTKVWLWLFVVPGLLYGPKIFLARAAARRIARIEEQIEAWINAVANALKASPSLAEAIVSTTTLVAAPMCQELEVLVKEYELGTPLDQALENFGARVQSKTLAGTITALKIARRSGGNLTEMLEIAAASLREFARLEGVVRTKTAEGKAQTFVIAMIPGALLLMIRSMDPHFFDPLFHSFAGQLIVAAAAVLWALAILLARKILDVDI
jgi:tight adherence protein B